MKNAVTALLLLCAATVSAQHGGSPIYKNPKAPIEKRVKDLVSRMTLEEKVYQLNQYGLGSNNNVNNVGEVVKNVPSEIGSLIYTNDNAALRNGMQKKAVEESRLGIPILFGFDVIHGFRTIYPISLAQACSWNPELAKRACEVAAGEAYQSGVNWTFSPMIDVARDPRWGRVAEGYGEDSYTNAVFATASVKGYQGDDLAKEGNIAACLKHYVGYGASEGGRDYSFTEISNQTLWSTYMPPYEAGVKAGVATVMSSFNDISGVPGTANHHLLTEVLKNRWKHKGFVVSDWNSVQQLIPQGVAADRKEAALKAFTAGVEMDMGDNVYSESLAQLVKENKIPLSLIDESVSRVLRLKFRLGLFEHPYTEERPDNERALLPESKKIAQQLAQESIVLLKNENKRLPLQAKRVAVIGPMAKEQADLLGSWPAHGRAGEVETIYDGLVKELAGKAEILYSKGCDFEGADTSLFSEASRMAADAEVVLLCLGEKRHWSGENASRASIHLPDIQEQLVKEMKKAGKPVVLVLSSGRPLGLQQIEPLCDAIVEIWQPGIAGGTPLAGILSGRINPSGKLAMTFPLTTGQIPVYYNERQRARPDQGFYQDIPTKPLYEFAHGLSYTVFEYGAMTTSSTQIHSKGKFIVKIPVTNTGDRDGCETVHWFISDPVCSISRPIKELKYFEKRLIRKGETQVFTFEVDPWRDLSFVNDKGDPFLEPGAYNILVKDQVLKLKLVE